MNEPAELIFELKVPAAADRLGLIRALVQRAMETAGCSGELSRKLVIAVNEACMNVIQHAYGGRPGGELGLAATRQHNQVVFLLTDHAPPADLDAVRPRDLDDIRPGGLGVHFIREIMDEVRMGHLDGGRGNYLEMRKNID